MGATDSIYRFLGEMEDYVVSKDDIREEMLRKDDGRDSTIWK